MSSSLIKEKEKYRNNLKNKNDPRNFQIYKTISNDIFNRNYYNNRACIFVYCNDNQIYIVYGVKSLDLECYDVIKEKKFIIMKKLHRDSFDSCRQFYDKDKNRNLILTSSFDEHVKVINFKKQESEIIIDLNLESRIILIINTACLINNKILVPFSNIKSGIIELYNMNSVKTGKIEQCGFILGLSGYYWKKIKKYFIIIANLDGILAYQEDDITLYKKFIPTFQDKKEFNGFDEGYIFEKNNTLILIVPCFYYGYLFFWDFVNGCLINKISLDSGLSDICIWDNNYIFASLNKGIDYDFILINTKYSKIEKTFIEKDEESRLCGIKVLRSGTEHNFLITFNMEGKLNLYKIKKPKKLIKSIYMITIWIIIIFSMLYILRNIFKYKIIGNNIY